MKFNCPGCRVTFNVPDDKIPGGKELKILCPKCRVPLELTDENHAGPDPHPLETSQEHPMVEPDDSYEDSDGMEIIEEGVQAALLCISDASRSERVAYALRQMDFYVSIASSAKLAMSRMHRNNYDLVILDEAFGGASQSENVLLHHIQFLPMHTRRQFFLCMLSEKMTTQDKMMAFRIGVDLILNTRDLERAKVLLMRAMKEHRGFYRVFQEEQERRGQF